MAPRGNEIETKLIKLKRFVKGGREFLKVDKNVEPEVQTKFAAENLINSQVDFLVLANKYILKKYLRF